MLDLSRILSCLAHHRPHRLHRIGHRRSSGEICFWVVPSTFGSCLRFEWLTIDVFEEWGSLESHFFSMPVLAVQWCIFIQQLYEFLIRFVYFRQVFLLLFLAKRQQLLINGKLQLPIHGGNVISKSFWGYTCRRFQPWLTFSHNYLCLLCCCWRA